MFGKYDEGYYKNISQEYEIKWPNYYEGQKEEEELTIINEDNYKENYFDILIDNKKTEITSKEIQNPILNENQEYLIKTQKEDYKYYTESKQKNNHLGRKRRNSNEKGKHNKYSQDNIIRKIKTFLLNILMDFINSYIYKIYNGNVGKGIFTKELKKMNQRQIINTKNNKEFLHKTLKDIFSEDISNKYSCLLSSHNKNLIQLLLNEEDNEKKRIFQTLFSLTFLDCLIHFRGSKKVLILDGLKTLDEFTKDYKEDKDYFLLLQYYIFHLEEIIMKKRQKNIKKNN